MRLALGSGVLLWLGITLLLSQRRWFARLPLTERLAPYRSSASPLASGRFRDRRQTANRSWVPGPESFREIILPIVTSVAQHLSRALGVREELAKKLERTHSPMAPSEFRTRQLGWVMVGLACGLALAAGSGLGPLFGLLATLGLPLLAFMVVEESLSKRSRGWQQRCLLELPVVAEQLAMLISAGFSIGGALNRVAARGRGVCAVDLARVCARIRQGMPESMALAEWSGLVGVPALDRVVAVLS
ncbi:MAG: hypothetical protein ACRD0E_09030, partial [Acidimicrobiales bacterium]